MFSVFLLWLGFLFFSQAFLWIGVISKQFLERIHFLEGWEGFFLDGRDLIIWLTFSPIFDLKRFSIYFTKRRHIRNTAQIIDIFLIRGNLGDSFLVHTRVMFLLKFWDQISKLFVLFVFFVVFFVLPFFKSSIFLDLVGNNDSAIAERIVNKGIVKIFVKTILFIFFIFDKFHLVNRILWESSLSFSERKYLICLLFRFPSASLKR